MAESPPKPPGPPLRSSLVSLDHDQPLGDTTDPVAKPDAPVHFELVGLDGDEGHGAPPPELVDDVEALDEEPPPEALHVAAPIQPAIDRFAAPAVSSVQMELDHPVAPAPPPVSEASAVDERAPDESGQLAPEPETWHPLPGKIADGALRKNPPLRLALGLGAGLLVGYVAAYPYARRIEHRVNAIRADANAERYRPFEEARQNAARLDAEADERASAGALATGAIWLAVGGAVVLGWYRFT